VVVAESTLRARVTALGADIARDYRGLVPILVGVLRGAFFFMADLARAIPIDLETDFIGVASYGRGTRTSGQVRITSDLGRALDGRHVLLVEDIVDTGLTLAYLRRVLEARRPASLKVCALLDKRARRQADVRLDYVGFTIEDVYVVGYGFDYAELYRNLPYVAALEDG
jgi:hypoxanthine phosphoribosyltransferase